MKVLFFLSALFLATTNAIEVSKGQILPARAAFDKVMKNILKNSQGAMRGGQ